MRKALVVYSANTDTLDRYLENGWKVENMEPFHGIMGGETSIYKELPMLVIISDEIL